MLPFGGYANPNISYYVAGVAYDWSGAFNAVHMAVIPKGPHQGKVLVWVATNPFVGSPVLIRSPGTGPPLAANQYHACAAWSIVDPADVPAGPRFRNFLLPLEVFTVPTPLPPELHAASLQVDYASTLRVACDPLPPLQAIEKVVLMAPGATTHHSDMHMRYVQLDVLGQPKPHVIDVRAPADDKFAPRGIYMMFVVTNRGAVADAIWVVLR